MLRFGNPISIKSKLQLLLFLVNLGSILTIGYLGWHQLRTTQQQTAMNQLTSVRSAKGQAIESYFNTLRNHVETLSEDRMVVEAMVELNKGFRELNQEFIEPQWETEIERYYEENFFPKLVKAIAGEPHYASYRPTTQAANYLQYHYIVKNPYPTGRREELADAKDGSTYSQFHAKYHDLFRNLIQKFGYYDLFLINFKTGDVVYTVFKETDLGANLNRGVNASSNLADVFNAVRQSPERRAIQIADFQPYRPSYMAPAAFIAGPIYNGPHIVGILALQIPLSSVNEIMTGGTKWEKNGLGKTGETYLIGSDLLMRSDSRFLIEAPQQYIADLRSAGTPDSKIQLIEQLKTSTLLQKVENNAARAAISGTTGTRENIDYRGGLSYPPMPLYESGGLDWAILSEMDRSEVYRPVKMFLLELLIAWVILSLLLSYLANWLARRFVRPIETMIKGETDGLKWQAVLRSQDELGELARVMQRNLQQVQQQAQLIEQKCQDNDLLLANALPLPIINRLKKGEKRIVNQVGQVTLLMATLYGLNQLSASRSVEETATIFQETIDGLDDLAQRYDVERFRTMGDRYIAVCGLTKPRLDHAKQTIDFALAAIEWLQTLSDRYKIQLKFAAGIDTGDINTGLIGTKKFAYELWGETWEITQQLNAKAEPLTLRVTQDIYDRLHEFYNFEAATDIQLEDRRQLKTWIIRKGGLRDLIDDLSMGLELDGWDLLDATTEPKQGEIDDSK